MKVRKSLRAVTTLIVIGATIISASSVTEAKAEKKWQMDSVAEKCIGSIIGGVIVGGLLGAITGNNKDVGGGVVKGLVVGGAACVVIAALDQEDKRRLKEAQLAAAQTGVDQNDSYSGSDGLARKVSTKVVPLEKSDDRVIASNASKTLDAAAGQRICRKVQSSVGIETKGDTKLPAQLICRTPDGDWAPV